MLGEREVLSRDGDNKPLGSFQSTKHDLLLKYFVLQASIIGLLSRKKMSENKRKQPPGSGPQGQTKKSKVRLVLHFTTTTILVHSIAPSISHVV